MVGLIERLISNQGVSEPKDGRVFYLDFGDGNQSYGRLLNAIASQNIRQELNNLINETQPVLGSLSDLPLQVLKLRAAALVLRDLTEQGWIAMVKDDLIYVYPKTAQPFDSKVEAKASSRASGQYARQDQLQDTSVRNFINALELPSRGSSHQPITNLIADGRTLREQLEPIAQLPKKERAERLGQVIQPYLQLVEHDKRCEHTNIKLADIWRYFRFYWSLPQNSSPGRNLFFLVRDAGQPHHPVMAIAALGNVVMQLTCRDRILGWTPTGFMELIRKSINLAINQLKIRSTKTGSTAFILTPLDSTLRVIFLRDIPIFSYFFHAKSFICSPFTVISHFRYVNNFTLSRSYKAITSINLLHFSI